MFKLTAERWDVKIMGRRISTFAVAGLLLPVTLTACGHEAASTMQAGAPGATPTFVSPSGSPSTSDVSTLSFASSGIVPKLTMTSNPQNAVCAYRHSQDGISLDLASSQQVQAAVEAGGYDEAKAMSTAIAQFGSRPLFTSVAAVTESPVILSLSSSAHDSSLPAKISNRLTYLVNISGIYDQVSGPAGSPVSPATDAEMYVDVATGVMVFTLECSRTSN